MFTIHTSPSPGGWHRLVPLKSPREAIGVGGPLDWLELEVCTDALAPRGFAFRRRLIADEDGVTSLVISFTEADNLVSDFVLAGKEPNFYGYIVVDDHEPLLAWCRELQEHFLALMALKLFVLPSA